MKRSQAVSLVLRLLKITELKPGNLDKLAYRIVHDLEMEGAMKPPVAKKCPVLHTIEHVWEQESPGKNEQNTRT